MISVVVPTYGRIAKLQRAIDSVLQQQLLPSEIIIVDDCSPEPIRLEDLPQSEIPIRLLRHDTNRGGSGARNTGIMAAQFDLIAFLDSDDSWHPEKLAVQMKRIRAFGAAGERIVSACNVFIARPDGEGRPYNTADRPETMDMSEWFLSQRGTYQTSGLLLPTELARAVLFDGRLRRHQDWDFLLRLEKFGAIVDYVHECLSIYNDEDDADRLSRVRSAEPTLTWYSIQDGLLKPHSMLSYYMHECFAQHFRHAPLEAGLTTLKLAAHPGGYCYAARFLGKRGKQSFRDRAKKLLRRGLGSGPITVWLGVSAP